MLYLLIILFPIITFVIFLTSQQTRMILPATVNSINPLDITQPFETLAIETPDGAILHGVLFPATTTSNTTLILAFPGNTHNAVGFASFLKSKVFPEDNIAVAALSYRGYPNGVTPASTGTPSQAAMYADSELIYDHLTQQLKPANVKIAAYSIGTAVAVHLALSRPVASMVLMAPMASIRRIVQGKYPWLPVRLLLRHPFATEDVIANLKTPTTLIYTPTDELVPASHVEKILHAANPSLPIIKIEGATHTTLILDSRIPNLIRKVLGL